MAAKGDRKRVVDGARWRWMSMQRVPKVATSSSPEGKMFAQFGAIRLVQREIGSLVGKFFLAGVQAVRTGIGGRDASMSSSRPTRSSEVAKKKKRVLPMFFSGGCPSSASGASGRDAVPASHPLSGAAQACRPRKKKLREGVDTLKNRD
ncbi:hypothetical protein J2X02_000701 [Pseudoxanthomonas japonensis]|uniref:hypothetical protein n=1 Tax=Pseudoxanthomonas TaxID=83618 RepID=UPI0012EE8FA2|nr:MULTISPECIES: hypothetical protein [Pseudoxanthomonas]MBL8256544.1 hypothetical protein [Pseudoxanthomonas mexicana]MDR7067884.1 hypothetical protein [Pseudoxanthomonas japonensis]